MDIPCVPGVDFTPGPWTEEGGRLTALLLKVREFHVNPLSHSRRRAHGRHGSACLCSRLDRRLGDALTVPAWLARAASSFLRLSTGDRFEPRQRLSPPKGADCCNRDQLFFAGYGLFQFPVVNRLITHSQQSSKVWRRKTEAVAQGSKTLRNESQWGRGCVRRRCFGRFCCSLRKQACLSAQVLDLALQCSDLTAIGCGSFAERLNLAADFSSTDSRNFGLQECGDIGHWQFASGGRSLPGMDNVRCMPNVFEEHAGIIRYGKC